MTAEIQRDRGRFMAGQLSFEKRRTHLLGQTVPYWRKAVHRGNWIFAWLLSLFLMEIQMKTINR